MRVGRAQLPRASELARAASTRRLPSPRAAFPIAITPSCGLGGRAAKSRQPKSPAAELWSATSCAWLLRSFPAPQGWRAPLLRGAAPLSASWRRAPRLQQQQSAAETEMRMSEDSTSRIDEPTGRVQIFSRAHPDAVAPMKSLRPRRYAGLVAQNSARGRSSIAIQIVMSSVPSAAAACACEEAVQGATKANCVREPSEPCTRVTGCLTATQARIA